MATTLTPTTELAETLEWCSRQSNPINAVNDTVLNSVDYSRRLHDGSHPGQLWRAQRQICRALHDDSVTTVAVPAGHSVGKSYVAARVIIGWLALHAESLVISTGPSNTQIEEVLWKEVRLAFRGSALQPYGRLTANPQKLDFGDGYHALGYSTNKAERLQGHHARGPVLVVIDEASGVEDPEVWATLSSLKPRKRLLISNPLRPDGPFYDACRRSEDDPSVRLIRIPSLESPDIDQHRSERGLADAAWLEEMRGEYGEESLVWKVRVKAQFPDDATDAVFNRAWLEAARLTIHQPGGRRRTSIDVALGNGGDAAVVLTRDANGVLACEASNRWSLETLATKTSLQCQRFGVEPSDVSFDAEGVGADFANRLQAVGIIGARPYRGGAGGGKRFGNLRSAAAWATRQRIDPHHMRRLPTGVMVPQVPFSLAAVPDSSWGLLKKELQELRYEIKTGGVVALETAEDYALRLKRSPDHQACFCQSFSWPEGQL